MEIPVHPLIVHIPLVITFILPILIIVFALMIHKNKMSANSWLIVIGLQLTVVAMGYISLETGETEEHNVKKVVSKKLIHAHEEAAEVFVGVSVLALVLSIGSLFLKKEIAFPVKLVISLITLLAGYLAFQTGELGGELVYKHGAANAYVNAEPQGLLPTPGKNTSESPMPVEENESLKLDENDYGNAGEVIESPDDYRQED